MFALLSISACVLAHTDGVQSFADLFELELETNLICKLLRTPVIHPHRPKSSQTLLWAAHIVTSVYSVLTPLQMGFVL